MPLVPAHKKASCHLESVDSFARTRMSGGEALVIPEALVLAYFVKVSESSTVHLEWANSQANGLILRDALHTQFFAHFRSPHTVYENAEKPGSCKELNLDTR